MTETEEKTRQIPYKNSNSAIRPDACSHWHHLRLFYFVKVWFALECFALINYLYYIIFYVFYVEEMKKNINVCIIYR